MSHILGLSEDLPVVIEVVDCDEQMQKLMPIPDEMEGLIMLEKVSTTQAQALHGTTWTSARHAGTPIASTPAWPRQTSAPSG